MKEFSERLLVIEKGVSEYTKIRIGEILGSKNLSDILSKDISELGKTLRVYHPAKDPKEVPLNDYEPSTENIRNTTQTATQNAQSTATENTDKSRQSPIKYSSVKEKIETISATHTKIPKIELSEKDKELLKKLEQEHEEKIKKQRLTEKQILNEESTVNSTFIDTKENLQVKKIPLSHPSVKPKDTVSTKTLFTSALNLIAK